MAKTTVDETEIREQSGTFDWNASVEKAKKQPKIYPTLKLDVGQRAKLEFLEEQPNLREYLNKKKNQMEKNPAILVKNLSDGKEMILWVTAASLQGQVARLYAENGESLKGVLAEVSATTYKHPEYGTTKGYRAEQIRAPIN